MRTDSGQVFRLEDYKPSDYLIPETRLTFQLSPTATVVVAQLTIERCAHAKAGTPLILAGDGLELQRLEFDGSTAPVESFVATSEELRITAPPQESRFVLTIETELSPETNTALMGLYRTNDVYCTQCEAEGFRRITYFLDRPDILSTYKVRIEGDSKDTPILLSNGNFTGRGPLPGGRHFAEWHDPFPKPSYLFALVAGDLGVLKDRFTTGSGREVDLAIYVEHGKEARAGYAMDALKRSMQWDEEVFGREYDLDVFNIVAVSDFNMGAMENKGLNVFNDKFVLADQQTATDIDFAHIEAIIAHEYFHNWTGNRITCRDWFQLCLKEGLTVFRDHEFSADQRSRAVKRIAEVRALKANQFPEDAGPLAHPVRPRRYREINNFYTATVYEKGSEVVRMIRTIIGPEKFREGMDAYFDRHDGEAVTIEDFLRVFSDVSGVDLDQFALWYHQAGTPSLTIRSRHDRREKTFELEIEQSMQPTPGESRKRLMHIPLAFALVGRDGVEIAVSDHDGADITDGVIHVRKRRHLVRFKGIADRPVPSLLRGFSAPVRMDAGLSMKDRMFLAVHDSDPFARWQAMNALLIDQLQSGYKRALGGKKIDFADDLVALTATIAADKELEPAYRALILALPSEADIAREIGKNVNPDAVRIAREALMAAFASANAGIFRNIYDSLYDADAFSPDAASAGRRALRNTLLDYLASVSDDASLAEGQYGAATNMTDLAAALTVLTHRFTDSDAAKSALADFESRFSDDPIVLDKWFSIQATAAGSGAVDRVRELMKHKGFSVTNPNRVRALAGAFAVGNQTGFNRTDGSGYRLLTEVVLDVDSRNPQVAARLSTALRSWRSLEPARREQARQALADLAASDSLSVDLRDIVDRTLS